MLFLKQDEKECEILRKAFLDHGIKQHSASIATMRIVSLNTYRKAIIIILQAEVEAGELQYKEIRMTL